MITGFHCERFRGCCRYLLYCIMALSTRDTCAFDKNAMWRHRRIFSEKCIHLIQAFWGFTHKRRWSHLSLGPVTLVLIEQDNYYRNVHCFQEFSRKRLIISEVQHHYTDIRRHVHRLIALKTIRSRLSLCS